MPFIRVEMWPWIVMGLLLVVASITDLRYGRIYNVVTYPAVAIALIGHTLVGGIGGVSDGDFGLAGAAVGLAVGFLPLLAAWLAGGIGGGDAKVMAAIGALGGWRFALDTLFYGLAVAAVMAFAIMIHRRILLQTLKRVAAFVYLAFTPSKPANPTTQQSPKIAFGLALCIGAAIALAAKFAGWPGFLGVM